ncbi:MAG: FAD-dependent oxidoreductase [Myxococcales bacterium]|nr:FAD-dependent oxidoreductase [Myxococcales bacterium]
MTLPLTRATTLDALDAREFDVLVVGGGINGAVSAAALAARGARVALVERGDFAGFTSSHSSNLAWGGIKYMETYELGLVRKLCRSRNRLLRAYPSAVREIRFFTVVTRGSRYGRLLLYLGSMLYWVIGSMFTRAPKLLSNADLAREEPGIDTAQTAGGVEYSDAHFVDGDAHFVFRFVRDAVEDGAVVANYAESLGSTHDGEHWSTRVRDRVTGRTLTVRSRVIVNACGPYAEEHNARSGVTTRHRHLFSKGVHLVVERITHAPRVLTFFATDGRLFFVLPLGNRSSIGTTDTRVDQLPAVVTDEDRAFILSNINQRLSKARPLTERDVIAERCGVRPLVVQASDDERESDDWTQLSRKHVLEIDEDRRHLCIFGGKLTDCINVGHEVTRAVGSLGVELRAPSGRWYGEADATRRDRFMQRARGLGLDAAEPEVGEAMAERWWRRHGPRAEALLDAVAADPAQAEVLIPGTGITRAEAHYAAQHEMVVHLEDFLRRRTLVEQVVPAAQLRAMPQLRQLSEILFDERAEQELATYLRGDAPLAVASSA